MKKTEVAKELGVSRTRLHTMIKEGIVTPEADGSFDVSTARAEMKANLSAVHGGRRTSCIPVESFSEARTRKEKALADLREMESAVMRGELVDANELRHELATVFTVVKQSLRSIPAKVAQEVFHIALNAKEERTGVAAIFKLMLKEIDAVLTELSKYRVAKK